MRPAPVRRSQIAKPISFRPAKTPSTKRRASSTGCDTYGVGAGVTAALCWHIRLSGSRCRGVESALTAATTRDLLMPNKHHLLADLSLFEQDNRNEIFIATEDTHGLIEATLTR